MAYDGFVTGSGLSKVRVFSDFSDRNWPMAVLDPKPSLLFLQSGLSLGQ
jgi:hypothetical protein